MILTIKYYSIKYSYHKFLFFEGLYQSVTYILNKKRFDSLKLIKKDKEECEHFLNKISRKFIVINCEKFQKLT